MDDEISKAALKITANADEPLETKEIKEKVSKMKDTTRTKYSIGSII